MSIHSSFVHAAALALTIHACPAAAATQVTDNFSFSGFGTFGGTVTDHDGAQYRSDARQPRGADESVDLGVDSKLGLQGNLKFNDTFSAVGQVLASRRMSDRPVVEWLYGEASLPAGFSAKLGRMVLPTFMLSDSRAVGYASHWLRAPQTVYALYPASSFDGGQLQFRGPLGPVNLTAQVSLGETKTDISARGAVGHVRMPKLRSLNLLAESGNWMVRFGRTVAPDTEIKGLPFPKLEDKFTGFGVQYDNGSMLVMAEYAVRRQNAGGLLDSNSWYVSGGWRLGPWMPYATLGGMAPKGPGLGTTEKDKLAAIGLRWDAMKNVAVKTQLERIVGGSSVFIQASPAFTAERPAVHVFSVNVDFVF